MDSGALKNFEYISQSVGVPVEYTQGGGGNTSVKLDGELMAVKASGFKLKQINPREGYVVVNYKNILDFYDHVDLSLDRDYEKESGEFVKSNTMDTEGLKKLRPSVEAGFHSVLKKYVIHTHPVYANILCCAQNGRELVEKIFKDKEYATAWIPYINPGFCLTLKIREAIGASAENGGKFPQAIFMENHGLIVTDDDPRRCVSLHQEVNDSIRRYLGIKDPFPAPDIFRVDDNTFISKTEFIAEFFRNNRVGPDYFDAAVLYPDQLVYLNGNIAVDSMDKKLNINAKTGEIIYRTNFSEAQTMEETLLAYLYVISGVRNSGLALKTMTGKDVDFIRNWESEAYRKSLVRELGK